MFFEHHLANKKGFANGRDIASYLTSCGLLRDDPRFTSLYSSLLEGDHQYKPEITLEQFIDLLISCNQGILLERAFRQQLISPEFVVRATLTQVGKVHSPIGKG
jgi:EF-hand domain